MIYTNDMAIMDWKNTIMREGILSFKSQFEPIKYTIAFCSLHKDIKNPWFVVVKVNKIGKTVTKSHAFGLESERELIKQLQKLKRLGYVNCPID